MMIWSLDTDDFTNKCMTQAYPVLNTVVTELNDPTFVKRNISVVFANPNVTPSTTTTSKPIEKQTRPNFKTLDKIDITSTTVAPQKRNQQTTVSSTDLKETELKLTTKADKGQIIIKNMKNKQQQQKEIKNSLNEQQNQSQKQPQKKVLSKNDSKKKSPKVKRIVKMKVRRRFKHKQGRKGVPSKHKTSNRQNKRNKTTEKKKVKQTKTPTKMEIKTDVSSLGKAKKIESKQETVTVNNMETKTIVENRKDNDSNVVSSNQMLKEEQTPRSLQEKGKAKPHKNESIVNRIALSDAKDKHQKETKQSSTKEVIHNLLKNDPTQEQKENNQKLPIKETGKTLRITSKGKQAIKTQRENKEPITTAEKIDREHKSNNTLSKHSVIKEKSPESSKNSKSGVVSSSKPMLRSTTLLSSTSSPLKLKVAPKRVTKKVRRRKGKVPKKGRRLKRRIKKLPKVSSVKS